jgi:hypothetical protein
MVSSPSNADIPNLGSISPDQGKLSADDANDSLGQGGTLPTGFQKVGVSDKRPS